MFFNFPFGPGAAGPNVFFEMGGDGFSEDDFHHFNAGGGNDIDKDKDYYKILGVDEKANEDEIKKAYRRMSMLHHPDKNGNTDESKQKFQELNNAYEVLSEANKRRTYDNMRRGGGGVGGGVPFGGQSFFRSERTAHTAAAAASLPDSLQVFPKSSFICCSVDTAFTAHTAHTAVQARKSYFKHFITGARNNQGTHRTRLRRSNPMSVSTKCRKPLSRPFH
jgi:DnaJ-class molecular chaperone